MIRALLSLIVSPPWCELTVGGRPDGRFRLSRWSMARLVARVLCGVTVALWATWRRA